ncbi:DUF1223 domain-containing protein [Noviherbaspirillum cavernae]|uniref:DUF1223 domain-containing protein n=1 Tax=Noviherbaspirillum cavernae TaxID=2320862 RepID=A0A418X320_9BURK|nr:DUF1223 domain-containing protein [Noviherbaspirillum cavernae]RJG06850.1 DUF1223 domain-containing protein [Noviherbaspirillum cavernae]
MKTLATSFTLFLALFIVPWPNAVAQACSKQSPAHTVALLELYTSEGCSSCPPADQFVSKLRDAGLTAEQVVPLSLHVDYWDYIGWKDIYAKRTFTERQRWLSERASSRTIYTPEIFVAGKELRNWRSGVPAAVRRANERPAQADIRIALGALSDAGLPVDVNAQSAQGGQLFVALYENGLTSVIRAGENRGVTLQHDYVVRDWIGPIALNGAPGKAQLQRALALPAGAAKNLGVAAFVQSDTGEVLQALALPVCAG